MRTGETPHHEHPTNVEKNHDSHCVVRRMRRRAVPMQRQSLRIGVQPSLCRRRRVKPKPTDAESANGKKENGQWTQPTRTGTKSTRKATDTSRAAVRIRRTPTPRPKDRITTTHICTQVQTTGTRTPVTMPRRTGSTTNPLTQSRTKATYILPTPPRMSQRMANTTNRVTPTPLGIPITATTHTSKKRKPTPTRNARNAAFGNANAKRVAAAAPVPTARFETDYFEKGSNALKM